MRKTVKIAISVSAVVAIVVGVVLLVVLRKPTPPIKLPPPCDSPVGGNWSVHRGLGKALLFGDETNQVFTFTPGEVDAEGYQWYNSTAIGYDTVPVTDRYYAEDGPIIRLGFREEVVDALRYIKMKVKGRLQMIGTDYFRPLWSVDGEIGTPEGPGPISLATIDDDSCFKLDAIDFSSLGLMRMKNDNVTSVHAGRIILQRE